jgi:hypothetical protein
MLLPCGSEAALVEPHAETDEVGDLLSPQRSEDPLWDLYARLLSTEFSLHRVDELQPLNRGVLQHLRSASTQFGNQPEYWELLCFEATRQQLGAAYVSELLQIALAHDLGNLELRWFHYQFSQLKLGLTDNEAKQLVEELVEAFPNESILHYELAFLLCNEGAYGEAMKEFAIGNAAPSNRVLLPYPARVVHGRLASDRPLADMAVDGLVLEATEFLYPRMSAYWMDGLRAQTFDLEVRAGLHGRAEEMVTFYQFLSKLAVMEDGSCLDTVLACNFARKSLQFLLDQEGWLTESDRTEVDKLLKIWAQVLTAIEHNRGSLPGQQAFTSGVLKRMDLADELARLRAAMHGEGGAEQRAHALESALYYNYVAQSYLADVTLQQQTIIPLVSGSNATLR